MAATGCQWRMLPREFPPVSAIQCHVYRLRDTDLRDLISETLSLASRVSMGVRQSRQQVLSTAKASKRQRAVGLTAMMRARKSGLANAILLWILRGLIGAVHSARIQD